MGPLTLAVILLAGIGQPAYNVVWGAGSSDAVAGVVASSVMRAAEGPRSCVIRYWNEARYRSYGYDHIVHFRSGCSIRARCAVSTNVNPKPVKVSVEAAKQTEVLTFRGSPSRVFAATVTCELGR